MRSHYIRKHLQQAAQDVERVSDNDAVSDDRALLAGLAEQLNYFAEGDTADPEATVQPDRGVLDSIQHRLSTVIDRTDDEPCVDRLRNAREQLLLVIMTLEDQWQNQHRIASEDERANR